MEENFPQQKLESAGILQKSKICEEARRREEGIESREEGTEARTS